MVSCFFDFLFFYSFIISPFLILIEVLFFNCFNDDFRFSILSEGTFGSFSRSEIASSIDWYSFMLVSSVSFFIIKRGANTALPDSRLEGFLCQ